MEMPVSNYLFQTVMTFSRSMEYAKLDKDKGRDTIYTGVLGEVLEFIKKSLAERFVEDPEIEIDATWRIINDYSEVAYDIFVTQTAKTFSYTDTYHTLTNIFTEVSLMFEGFDTDYEIEELDSSLTGIWIACTHCRGRGYRTYYSNSGRNDEDVPCPNCQDMIGNELSQTDDESIDFYSLRSRVLNKKSIYATT